MHAAPLLRGLRAPVVELGASGGKVRGALPPGALAVDWVREGLAAPAVVADVRALPLRDASAGSLVAIHVLGHLLAEDRARAAAEWARVLRPGGSLVLETFASGDARAGRGELVESASWARDGIVTHHFEAGEVEALFPSLRGTLALEERRLRWGTRRAWRGVLVAPS